MRRERALGVSGQLVLTPDRGDPLRVTASQGVLTVDFASLASVLGLSESLPPGARRRDAARALGAVLSRAGLELEARVGGRRVARLGGARRGSWYARRLGLPGLELSMTGLARAALAPRRPV